MAQVTVKSFYNTRKRQTKAKNPAKEIKDSTDLSTIYEDDNLKPQTSQLLAKAAKNIKREKISSDIKCSSAVPEAKQKSATKKSSAKNVNKQSKSGKAAKKDKTKQTTVTEFYTSVHPVEVGETQVSASNVHTLKGKSGDKAINKGIPEKTGHFSSNQDCDTEKSNVDEANILNEVVSINCEKGDDVEIKPNSAGSPKRLLSSQLELTPKKKAFISPCKNECVAPSTTSPKSKSTPTRRKLDMCVNVSPSKVGTCLHTPEKESRSPRKLLSPMQDKLNKMIERSRFASLSPEIGELRKSLENFSRKSSIAKKFESNPYKITSVVSKSQSLEKPSALPSVPAYKRFSYLADPNFSSSLILPYEYKLLSEMFRSMDTVISILNNRKESITFEKVCEGVQKMMKRTFSKKHLGQIMAVLPSAYNLSIEKCGFMNKKIDSRNYQLIITPNLDDKKVTGKKNKKTNSGAFIPMDPQCLIDRRNEFNDALLKIVKEHHQKFLSKLKFPVDVPDEKLKRWHPKFPLDSVADIQPAQLPEPPEVKIYTAKDVLNKVQGTLKSKVEKALQSVVDESKKPDVTIELYHANSPKPEMSKAALKGICSDLLKKVRARESAKLLESMTRTPDETKRQERLERLPKIIHILWHYFIAERKAAVPIDIAIEKIIHSCNSLATPDDVKDHLKLITEVYPGWLSFIEITKGVYIRIDKQRDINDMLDNFKP